MAIKQVGKREGLERMPSVVGEAKTTKREARRAETARAA